jgi:hypothetical protein
LDYEKLVSTGVEVKILISSFLPFSTASAHSGHAGQRVSRQLSGAKQPRRWLGSRGNF